MTGPLLEVLGQTSLSAAVMILAVLALRLRFRHRTPQRVFCLLWDIVLLRLLLPVNITSPVSVQRLMAQWPVSTQSALVQDLPAAQVALVDGTAFVYQEKAAQDVALVSFSPSAPDGTVLLTALWLAGLLACGAWLLWGHLRSRTLYADSLPICSSAVLDWQSTHPIRRPVQVRCSDRITSPLTYGVFYPVVLLPAGMDLEDTELLSCVLTHEYTHIRRFDTLRKGLLALALCLHWFNPFVWAMHILANRDIELACDEAVVRSGANRRSYALALLRLEEERGQGFLSGSSFSRNCLSERIEAIMKLKKFSLTTVVAVLAAMSIATTVFATSAPEPEAAPSAQNGTQVHSYTESLKETVMSMLDENGNTLYSVDGGGTWMSEDRYHAEYGSDWGDGWTVEWWTAEEYAAWLEQEKKNLQELIGEKAYTGGDGWFVWDQQKVDETIALYEQILEDIKNGALYSRYIHDADGSLLDDVALGSDGTLIASVIDSSEYTALEKDFFQRGRQATSELLAECETFGLSGSEKDGLFYNGQSVRSFVDGVSVGDGGYGIKYTYYDENGTVDVHTLRAIAYNPDGSYNPFGNLIGLAASGSANFDQGLIDSTKYTDGIQSAATDIPVDIPSYMDSLVGGKTFAEIFAQYESCGLTCTPGENSFVNLFYNGQSVHHFVDIKPDGSTFTYENPFDENGITLYTAYDEKGDFLGLTDEIIGV